MCEMQMWNLTQSGEIFVLDIYYSIYIYIYVLVIDSQDDVIYRNLSSEVTTLGNVFVLFG